MLCIVVSKGSTPYVQHYAYWTQDTRSSSHTWLAEREWFNRYRMKTRLAASTSGSRSTSEVFIDLAKYHPDEVKVHLKEIAQLRNLVKQETYIPSSIADFQLVQFLHSVRYNVNAAHNALRVNYKTKQSFPNLFTERNPFAPEIQQAWMVVNMFSLPETTESGQKILYCGFINPDPNVFDLLSTMKLFTMSVEATLMTEGLHQGYVIILDAKGLSLRHCPFSTLPLIRKFIFFIQEGMPINIVEIHVINTSPIVEKMYTFVKPFVRKELHQIILFHQKKSTSLQTYVPLRYLHSDMGGSLQTASHYQREFKERVETMAEWYKAEENQRRGEKLMHTPK